MSRKELLKLILDPEVFDHIAYLLISLDIVTVPDKETPSMSRLVLTRKGKEILKSKTLSIDAAFIKKYRSKFPVGRKGDATLTASNLGWLFSNYDVTEDQVLRATDLYLSSVDDMKYCQQADLFIYKNMPGGAIRNTILTFLEDLETNEMDNIEEEGFGCGLV